ncbi:MAG: hypothetical protein ACRD9R_09990 [Pyrinomonadaceae bacterium]
MQNKLATSTFSYMKYAPAVLTLIAALSAAASAQQQTGLPARERNIMGREHQLRTLEHGRPANTEEQARVKLAQINEDFLRLQAINNEMRKTAAAATLDYQSLAKSTDELKKRSLRLKKNLVFAKAEAGRKPPQGTDAAGHSKVAAALAMLDNLNKGAADGGQLKASLITLIATIRSFTTNPLFQQANVLDVDLSLKASGDLDDIIELSDRLRKLTKKMGDTAKSSS